ncbi:hypothetical protein ACHAWU_003830 [Discostella pseudostelligera]|uniref:Uncharacterized protein n=1 Tax=Discostella pseudostelligera TaxID=259834 RepID=A0ABD3MDE9_9STRA
MTTCRSIAIRSAIISLLAVSVDGASPPPPPQQQLFFRREAVSSSSCLGEFTSTTASRYQRRYDSVIAFQQCHYFHGSMFASTSPLSTSSRAKQRSDNIITNTICHKNRNNSIRNRHEHSHKNGMILLNNIKNDNSDEGASSYSSASFLSTDKAKVTFQNRNTMTSNTNNDSRLLSNTLSPIDQFLLTLTSDRTSLLLGSIGILLLLLNRLLTFPDDNVLYEASRSRMDLLGVFASGSVLLNGITKLDVESVRAEKVVLEGKNVGKVIWDTNTILLEDTLRSIVEWALLSYLKCTPAKTAILLAKRVSPQQEGSSGAQWMTLARVGVLPFDSQIPNKSPILDRIFSGDSSIKGGTVGGADVVGTAVRNRKGGPKESYLPTLQALPGKVEFTYLPSNAQEALILSVPSSLTASTVGGWHYAVVLGGDVAKSFAPRDIAWCKEIASWMGELV